MPGLLDLPAPVFEWLDDRLTRMLPAPLAVALWGVIAAVASLELYRVLSPQRRIDQLRRDARRAQERLSAYDGEFEGAAPLIRRMLGLSLKRVAIVLPATLVAALPVIVLLVWLSNSYGYRFPGPGEPVPVEVAPPREARWVDATSGSASRVQAFEPDGRLVLDLPVPAAVPVLHKHTWWNWLIGNPAGYLPDDAPFDALVLAMPRHELLTVGPSWLRGWEAVFLPVLLVAALAYKSARRIA